MDKQTTQSLTEVKGSEHPKEASLISPDLTMLILTWVTFFLLLALLQKFVWKPIIAALEKREQTIRQSLDDADKVKAHLAEVETSKTQILNEAKTQAAQIIDESRKTARNLAHDIETKARQSAQEIVNNASSQIEGERQRVRQALKKETVNIAIILAGKILKENIDTDKNRRLVDEAVQQI